MTPNKSSLSKPVKREQAIAHQAEFRERYQKFVNERDALVFDVMEAIRNSEHLVLNMDIQTYCEKTFAGIASRSFCQRLRLESTHLNGIPRERLESMKEGVRFILAGAVRDLTPRKVAPLIELATTDVAVDEFKSQVDAIVLHPDEHRERWEAIGARLLHSEKEAWQECIFRCAEALGLPVEAKGTVSAVYLNLRLAIDDLPLPELRRWLGAVKEKASA